jgi:hypothetical protein
MAFLPFLQKPQKSEEAGDDLEKKIEFAQKLPPEELEGKASPKGSDFDFLRKAESRSDGHVAPVKLESEPEPVAEVDEDEMGFAEKKDKKDSFFNRLLKGGSAKSKKKFQALEVNLVKGEIVKYFDWQRAILILLVSSFISITALSLAYWGISWWGSSRNYDQNNTYLQNYYKVSKEIKDFEPEVNTVLKFKKRLDVADFLLARHVYWTNFFNFLENNTLSNVYFSDFSGDTSGKYSLLATTNSLDVIDAQVKKLLADPSVKSASASDVSIGQTGGNTTIKFSLSFLVDPKIFLK